MSTPTKADKAPFYVSNRLHKLVQLKQWPEALERIKSNEAEVSKLFNGKNFSPGSAFKGYPLHHACLLNAPIEVINALMEANPRIIKFPDNSCQLRLALHHVILSQTENMELLLTILDGYPGAVTKVDGTGRLPLHYAIFKGAPRSFIDKLIELYPDGILQQDEKGWTPAHLTGVSPAAASLNIIRDLVDLRPDVVYLRDARFLSIRDLCILHQQLPKSDIEFLIHTTPHTMEMHPEAVEILKDYPFAIIKDAKGNRYVSHAFYERVVAARQDD